MSFHTSRSKQLFDAAELGDVQTVQALLKTSKAGEVNERWEDESTALERAARQGQTEIVRLLLHFPGIDVNLHNYDGWTALMLASYHGHVETVQLLVARPDLNVNLQNRVGCTALTRAAEEGHAEVVKLLLDCSNINVNVQDKDGDTALMLAASQNRISIVNMLLACPGIEVDLRNKTGCTALDMAKSKEIQDLIRAHPMDNWLVARLLQDGYDLGTVRDCVHKLVIQEGFASEKDFAECSPKKVTAEYLNSIGIAALGTQEHLLRLHSELQARYLPST